MTKYEAHELALIFPPMSEPEFAAFKEDIREHGQHEAIILYEGKILDGLHRYRACQELGREPRVLRFEGNPRAAAQLVLGRNFHRRHLTASQRALVAAEMCKLRPRGNTGTSPYLTAAQASTLMGVGQDLVKDAKHLLRSGDQDLLRSVRDGIQSVSAAVQEKRKKKATFTFLEQFAQRLDRALQGHNDRDAQVIYAAKPLLQYITLRIQDYLDPRTAEPLNGEDGVVLWDPAELKVPDWLYTERGEAIAQERRARLAAVLPKAKEAAAGFPGPRCAECGLPLLSTSRAAEPSYCAVCKGNVLWEWSWMREQVEVAFSSALRAVGPDA
ncbi:MAG TPA: ParB N-terminal domain-containing protein [Candidatus Deferrimicrobiaceae bacterium]|nr:ParB N-terminal domain-containing protein [Candidatus Deferrimicrobiaceae bacterium]